MTARADSAIIEFPQHRVRPAAALPEGATADVVIFNGVRIERLYDLAERLPSPGKSASRKQATGDIEFGR